MRLTLSLIWYETYTDCILIKVQNQLWIGQGHIQADVEIAYGKILAQTLPIDSAPGGYHFIAQLKYNSAMWDFITDPIIGTNDETYITETSAIAK